MRSLGISAIPFISFFQFAFDFSNFLLSLSDFLDNVWVDVEIKVDQLVYEVLIDTLTVVAPVGYELFANIFSGEIWFDEIIFGWVVYRSANLEQARVYYSESFDQLLFELFDIFLLRIYYP